MPRHGARRALIAWCACAAALGSQVALPGSASATEEQRTARRGVQTEEELRLAWADPLRTRIELDADIVLRDCRTGDPIRESPYPLRLDGRGHTIRQSCFEKRVLRQDGTGWLEISDVTLTRGGSDGPGAALMSRGEVVLRDCAILQNLSEEPGGGVFSMRRVTAHRCLVSGNLANDDGGGIYARRGGVQVYDSVLSTNLVDGSGGAVGSTGDIVVVRSKVDGNTTDGDGGALYADEDGDVVVVGSIIDGSVADGPGGAIFTLDGDVAVYDSTLIGNRADDRGGAISGEADVVVISSTIARNLAVAHAGGGVWARGRLMMVNATVTANYAEGEGGGLLSAGRLDLYYSTLTNNIAPVGGDLGTAALLRSFGSIIGPPMTTGVTGDTIPTRRACRVYGGRSGGYNFGSDDSCGLAHPTDRTGESPVLAALEDDPHGFVLVPEPDSPVRRQIPARECRPPLPRPLPAVRLLRPWVTWRDVLARDAVGRRRDAGGACDIGAVQSPGRSTRPALGSGRAPSGHVGPSSSGSRPAAPRRPVPPRWFERAGARAAPTARGPAADLSRIAADLRLLERQASRFDQLLGCLDPVGASQVGDTRHRWGYLYEERDGTGRDLRPALALSGRRRAQWQLLDLGTGRDCLSRRVDPNGAGADARPIAEPGQRAGRPDRLRSRLRRLRARTSRVADSASRFDDWVSCLTAVPVTESGSDSSRAGYLRGVRPRAGAALDVDHSEWDDPDYQLLGFRRGRDGRPRACAEDPGEAADRVLPAAGREPVRSGSLRRAIAALAEDVEDLGDPVGDIVRFDQCSYTVGAASRPGYRFRRADGREVRRSALVFDLGGDHLPSLNLLAFPGEEPPEVECNEDAELGGSDDD